MTASRSFSFRSGLRLAVAAQAGLAWPGRRRSSSCLPCDSRRWLSSCFGRVVPGTRLSRLEAVVVGQSSGRVPCGLMMVRNLVLLARASGQRFSQRRGTRRARRPCFFCSASAGGAGLPPASRPGRQPVASCRSTICTTRSRQVVGDLVVGQCSVCRAYSQKLPVISSRMNAAEEEAALPLQARLAQQAFEGAVGHRV